MSLPGTIISLFGLGLVASKLGSTLPIQSAKCDLEGRYSIRLDSPLASAAAVIDKEGFAPVQSYFECREPGIIVRNFRLQAAAACVEGTVLDTADNPISGAQISMAFSIATSALDITGLYPVTKTTDGAGVID